MQGWQGISHIKLTLKKSVYQLKCNFKIEIDKNISPLK